MFPVLNKKMDFASEIEQHKLIHEFLDKYHALIKEARKDPSRFDFSRIKALMQESRDVLVSHFVHMYWCA